MDRERSQRLSRLRQPGYDISQTYEWNYENVPVPKSELANAGTGAFRYGGRKALSPVAVAAGPLLNGRWAIYYASLGFDVLTYKTVRSRARACYPMPNLQPVDEISMERPGLEVMGRMSMSGSWAVSFGMPSQEPAVWRADVRRTRAALAPGKILSVSVVASPEPDWDVERVAADYALCAGWAAESGADVIEANLSCPNVRSSDGQLYKDPNAAAKVARAIRAAAPEAPLILKIGFMEGEAEAAALLAAVAPHCAALAMVNCISARVRRVTGEMMFSGELRGIAGEAIRASSLRQCGQFARAAASAGADLEIIGVGGVRSPAHVQAFLDAGCASVQVATAAMVNPALGVHGPEYSIKR